jgi:aminoglycoside phosphotransferase (APT) family kinase protein
MTDRPVERGALRVLWTTLRHSFAPELTTPLAKDRAKRADAALSRLVAGYEILPAVRAAHASRYAALLARTDLLVSQSQSSSEYSSSNSPQRPEFGNPVFVGVPEVAGELEAKLLGLAQSSEQRGTGAADVDRLLKDIACLEADCRGDYETRVMSMVASVGPDSVMQSRDITVEAVQRYLAGHPRVSRNCVVRAATEIPGGRSKRTVLVSLDRADPLPVEIVLRLDTGRGTGTSVSEEFPLLERVAKRGLPVPEPLWLETSSKPLGFPFIVFRRMPGAPAGDLMGGAFHKEPATGRTLARTLGRIHAAGNDLIEDPAARGSAVPHTRALLQHYLDWWRSKKPFPSLVIEAAFVWLFRKLQGGLGNASVVQADTGFHNLLIDDAGNGCLLDWEFAHFGDPAEDLASCRPVVEACMPWTEFMAEYERSGGSPVSDFRLNYFEIWRPLRNAVVSGTVLHSLMQGEAHDIDPVTIGVSTFTRLQADLAKSLNAILSQTS